YHPPPHTPPPPGNPLVAGFLPIWLQSLLSLSRRRISGNSLRQLGNGEKRETE
ncbi:hypothetical protein QUC31_010753, partial [Theobroma cacao]